MMAAQRAFRTHGGAFALCISMLLGGCVTTGGPAPSADGADTGAQSGAPGTVEKVMTGRQKMEIVARQIQEIPPRVFPVLPPQINRATFGPMHKSLDFVNYECQMALTPTGERCSIGETLSYAFDTGTLSSQIVQSILPQSSFVFDPELDRLNLRSHFKYAGAEQKPHVTVIEATPNRIDFLVKMPKATVAEAYEAAKAYCTTQGKQASFAGVNVGCIRPDAALIAANQKAARITGSKADRPQNLWYSYGVMAFDCGSGNGKAGAGVPGTMGSAAAVSAPRSASGSTVTKCTTTARGKQVCREVKVESEEEKAAKAEAEAKRKADKAAADARCGKPTGIVGNTDKVLPWSNPQCSGAPSFMRGKASECCSLWTDIYVDPKTCKTEKKERIMFGSCPRKGL